MRTLLDESLICCELRESREHDLLAERVLRISLLDLREDDVFVALLRDYRSGF